MSHRHIDTRWEFGREGVSVYCRECKKWRTLFETGYDPADGLLLEAWPGPEPGTFEYQMDKLRRQVRELAVAIIEAAMISDFVAWLDVVIFRWRLKRNVRRHYRRFKNLRVDQVKDFLDEIGLTEEQFKSIRKDIR